MKWITMEVHEWIPISFLICILHHHVNGGGCPANGFPSVNICKGGSSSGDILLLDFFGASKWPGTVCKCDLLIIRGKEFQFSQVTAPGYQGCGTEVHIQKYAPHGDQGGSIMKCFGGTSINVKPGDSLTVTLYKHAPPKDTRYCYRMDITGQKHPAMSLTCTEVATPKHPPHLQTTSLALTRDATTVVQTSTTVRIPSNTRSSVNVTHLDRSLPFVDSTKQCQNTNYLTGVIVLSVSLAILAVYAAFTTFKLYLRKRKPYEETSNYTDIYEEIPVKRDTSARPVYNDGLNSNSSINQRHSIPLPDLPSSQAPCRNCSNVSLIPLPRNPGVWNWTYADTDKNTDVISGINNETSRGEKAFNDTRAGVNEFISGPGVNDDCFINNDYEVVPPQKNYEYYEKCHFYSDNYSYENARF